MRSLRSPPPREAHLIDFLLVWEANPNLGANSRAEQELLSVLGRLRIVSPTLSDVWRSERVPGLRVFAWGHDVAPLPASKRILSSKKGFSLFNGWMLPRLGDAPLGEVGAVREHLAAGSFAAGEFLFLDVDANGDGRIIRNLLGSVQLYSHQSKERVLLSTRPSIIAGFLGGRGLNLDFARWVGTYSVPQTSDSLYESVTCVAPGSEIKLEAGRPKICSPTHNILASEALQLCYREDRSAYWDEVFENLLCLMRVVEGTDLSIDFPLSGGKDSRLMLGLVTASGHRDRISRVFTNGPDFSPEVRSAKAVAEHFGLPHEEVWSGGAGQGPAKIQITPELPLHLLITEGEMSPIDLTSRMSPRPVFQLSGQESGLRNIAGNRDVSTRAAVTQWLKATVGQGDICGIMKAEIAARNLDDVESYLDGAIAAGVPFEQIPTRHRVEFRGSRWVSRVWGATNAITFSPHIFRSEIVTLATYNSGARSRRLEEFHFEMLKRIDPRLVELPFAGQTWNPELLHFVGADIQPPEPLSWPEDFTPFAQRPMFGALQQHFDLFKQFVVSNSGPVLDAILDMDRLRQFDVDQLKPGHVQPLWQIFQCALLESVEDVSKLRERTWEELELPDFALTH
jgi:hypothetical protein